ncbi:MAG: hypothetical protein J3Q66DRAFT_406798 [Benniella sp.]|nr:MAG: hypothetical protein J3Q66DRAFT_406798 [Benniella sp.]
MSGTQPFGQASIGKLGRSQVGKALSIASGDNILVAIELQLRRRLRATAVESPSSGVRKRQLEDNRNLSISKRRKLTSNAMVVRTEVVDIASSQSVAKKIDGVLTKRYNMKTAALHFDGAASIERSLQKDRKETAADTCIGKICRQDSHPETLAVVTNDSDLILYEGVNNVTMPIRKKRELHTFFKSNVLKLLHLPTVQHLQLAAVLTRNDYFSGIPWIEIKTNADIVRDFIFDNDKTNTFEIAFRYVPRNTRRGLGLRGADVLWL